MATVKGVFHSPYAHIATHRRTWKIKREGGVAVKNAYTVVRKGPIWMQPNPYPQLQDRTTRSGFTVVVKGPAFSTAVKSRP